MVVVGNKLDLESMRAVSNQTAEDYARSIGGVTKYIEASAKSGEGIDQIFMYIAQQLCERLNKATLESPPKGGGVGSGGGGSSSAGVGEKGDASSRSPLFGKDSSDAIKGKDLAKQQHNQQSGGRKCCGGGDTG